MKKATADYRLIIDSDGKYRFLFFCDLCGSLEYTSLPINGNNAEKELCKVWSTQGKSHFNLCRKCGKWVSTEMFNADVLECVACAPWEDAPKFCPHCGKKVENSENHCAHCGKSLRYEGGLLRE